MKAPESKSPPFRGGFRWGLKPIKNKEIYLRWLGILIIGLLFPLIIKFGDEYLVSAGFSLFYTTLCWNGCVWIKFYFDKKYKTYEQTKYRILYATVFTIIYFMFINLGVSMTLDYLVFEHNFDVNNYFRTTILAILLGMGINAMYELAFFWTLLREKIKETEKLRAENLQSQFEVLKNQVNPHFLFNSLNTLITIIPENPLLAVEFTEKLSSVYRYILQNKDKELVSLATELAFAKAYIFMLKIRFGDNFKVKIDIPEDRLNHSVAPLTLQMLIENALKHNIVSTEKPLLLEIHIENGRTLIVKNNLQRKNQPENSTRLGLANIKKRYAFLSDREVDVIVTSDNFLVALPLLQLNGEELSYV
jgi:sensor histidine kinase YesM